MEKILFTGENGEKVEFFVIEEAKLNGTNYLLVTESEDEDDEEAMAYIMKQVAKNSDKDLTYEFVEDEKEIEAVAGLLEELLDGEVDLVPEED
ncbi:MAG: DUF1292 domain-containing protein [Lachnospiraceae bacterium]|nr:DUF1292 domain-containing protein [Lachnospiraceae bacterium]